jgi:serine/threonine-protein phosphatase 6 regulatory ankyrin repeat subunit A
MHTEVFEEVPVEEEVEEDQELAEQMSEESDMEDSDIEIEEQDEIDGGEFLWENMPPDSGEEEEEAAAEEDEEEHEIVREDFAEHSISEDDALDSIHEPAHEIPEQIAGEDEVVAEPEEFGRHESMEFSFRRPPAEVRRHFPFPSSDQESMLGEPAEVALFRAVDSNNMELVRKCLGQGADVHWMHPDKERKTCIHVASEKGLLKILKLLIEKGGKSVLDKQDKDGWSALHWAAYNDHSECVRELWANGSPVVRDKKGKTSVYWTGRQQHTTAAATLIGLAINNKDGCESTDQAWRPIHLAAARGSVDELHAALRESNDGVDPSLPNSGRALAAHEIVDAVEMVSCCGLRPLHLAAMCGEASCVRELLALGAAIDTADSGGKTALHRAARSGSVAVLQVLLEHASGRDAINAAGGGALGLCAVVDEDGRTALHDAAYNGHIEAAQLLTDAGAPLVDVRELDGSTPLLLAAYSGHSGLVTLLIDAGADVSAQDVEGRTPLHDACMNNHLGVVRTLLAHGANVLARNSFGRTPLHDACSSSNSRSKEGGGDSPCSNSCSRGSNSQEGGDDTDGAKGKGSTSGSLAMELLLHCTKLDVDAPPTQDIVTTDAAVIGARQAIAGSGVIDGLADVTAARASSVVQAMDAEGMLPIHEAASHGATDAVRLMLSMGAPVSATKRDGQTTLHLAAAGGHKAVLGLLLSRSEGEELLDRGDSNGDCPLHWAAFKGQHECVRKLLESGASANSKNADGGTALHSAANCGDTKSGEVLLEHGADVNVSMVDGNTPLHNAAYEGHCTFVQLMLSASGAPNATNTELRTALHEAACNGHWQVAELLLVSAAVIDAQDSGGDTPLHWAVCNGHSKCTSTLLKWNASLVIANVDGGTPLHAALINNEEECVRKLVAAGADLNGRMCAPGPREGDTCIHLAAADGQLTCLKLLVEKGASINALNPSGNSPLHHAAMAGQQECAAFLISAAADVSIANTAGRTALQLLASNTLVANAAELRAHRNANRSMPRDEPYEAHREGHRDDHHEHHEHHAHHAHHAHHEHHAHVQREDGNGGIGVSEHEMGTNIRDRAAVAKSKQNDSWHPHDRPLAARPSSAAPAPPAEWMGFASFFGREDFCDLMLLTPSGERIPTHKVVLSARCEPFRAMLGNGMKESSQDVIRVEYEADAVRALLEVRSVATVVTCRCWVAHIAFVMYVALVVLHVVVLQHE